MFFANGFLYASYVPRLPEIQVHAGISTATLGLVLTLGNLAGLIGSFFTGSAIPQFGSKPILIVGSVFYALALPAIGFAPSALLLVAALVVMAVFDVFIDVAMNLQGSVVSAERDRPVMSRLHGAWSLGTLAGGGSAAVAAEVGLPVVTHYLVVGAFLIVMTLVAIPGLRSGNRVGRQASASDSHPVSPLTSEERVSRWSGAAVALGCLSLVAASIDITVGEWTGFRLRDDLATSAGVAASAFVVFTLGMTAGRLLGDNVTARFGALATARAGGIVAISGLLAATLLPAAWVTFAGVAIVGLGLSVLAPLMADAAAKAPGPPGAGFTTVFVGHRVAGLVVPVGVGTLAGTEALSVGQAMTLIAVPAAGAAIALARPALRRPWPS